MNEKTKEYKSTFAIKDAPKIKTLDMRINAADSDLEVALKRAFALAKSAGQELNLTIIYGAS